jgi:hypothetical protein
VVKRQIPNPLEAMSDRQERVTIPLTAAEKKAWQEAAKKQDVSLSAMIRFVMADALNLKSEPSLASQVKKLAAEVSTLKKKIK